MTKKRKPTDDELVKAAARLGGLLTAYARSDTYRQRDGAVARAVEPLLRYYLTEHKPQLAEREARRDYSLASAAWQVLLFKVKGNDLRKAIGVIAGIRRDFDATDKWPADAGAVADEIERVRSAPRMRDLSRAARLFELFSEGYCEPDKRRGVRPDRAEFLREVRHSAPSLTPRRT